MLVQTAVSCVAVYILYTRRARPQHASACRGSLWGRAGALFERLPRLVLLRMGEACWVCGLLSLEETLPLTGSDWVAGLEGSAAARPLTCLHPLERSPGGSNSLI